MDIKEYIESGIIEAVVLGFASEQEIAQLQSYALKYPEISEEWKAVTIAFENEATKHAVPAPAEVKQRVLESISAKTKKNFYIFYTHTLHNKTKRHPTYTLQKIINQNQREKKNS